MKRYLFVRGKEKREVKMSKHEYLRLARVWNAYFYSPGGASSEAFISEMGKFTRGRVTRDMLMAVIQQNSNYTG